MDYQEIFTKAIETALSQDETALSQDKAWFGDVVEELYQQNRDLFTFVCDIPVAGCLKSSSYYTADKTIFDTLKDMLMKDSVRTFYFRVDDTRLIKKNLLSDQFCKVYFTTKSREEIFRTIATKKRKK